MPLDRQVVLDRRGKHVIKVAVLLAIFRGFPDIAPGGAVGQVLVEALHAIDIGLHPQEVAAHIRVFDDGYGGRTMILEILQLASLNAFPGIVHRQKIGCRSIGQALQADAHAGVVDHVEHDLHALALFPQEKTDTFALAAQGHAGRGAGVNAVLLFHARADNVVAFAQAAVVVDKIFGHDENGNALGSRRVSFDACQYRMNDVFRQVVLAIGDEDLVAGQGIGSVFVFNGCGLKGTHVAAGLGFGEQHGAAPFCGGDIGDVLFLLLRGAV